MSVKTILSTNGRVVIPKEIRDTMNIKPGQQFELIRAGEGVLLRPLETRHG